MLEICAVQQVVNRLPKVIILDIHDRTPDLVILLDKVKSLDV